MSLKSFNLVLLASVVILAGILVPRDAAAGINVAIDWTVGGEPTDFGYPTNHPVVDNSAGTWTNDQSSTQTLHMQNDLVNSLDDAATTPFVHGYADIQHLTFGVDSHSVFVNGFRKNNDVLFDLNVLENSIELTHGEFGTVASIPVVNNDGQSHRYGWELDRAADILRVFFDDLSTPVGNASGYSVATTNSDVEHWFGDRQGESDNSEVWSRFVIQHGQIIPEPSMATLILAGGLGLLAGFRRRARR